MPGTGKGNDSVDSVPGNDISLRGRRAANDVIRAADSEAARIGERHRACGIQPDNVTLHRGITFRAQAVVAAAKIAGNQVARAWRRAAHQRVRTGLNSAQGIPNRVRSRRIRADVIALNDIIQRIRASHENA